MAFILVLVAVSVLCVVAQPFLKRHGGVFYALCFAAVVVFYAAFEGILPVPVRNIMHWLMQKDMLSVAMFAVVMFIGVLPRQWRIAESLRAIRTELSIGACILTLGHVVLYLSEFLPRAFASHSLKSNVAVSFAVALVLAALLIVLGVTSLRAVKRRMETRSWKRLQRLAYAFFGLVYLHLMLMLVPSALVSNLEAQVSIAAYTAVFGTYAVCRVARAVKDRSGRRTGENDTIALTDEPLSFSAL